MKWKKKFLEVQILISNNALKKEVSVYNQVDNSFLVKYYQNAHIVICIKFISELAE